MTVSLRRIDHYVISHRIAIGGMAEVFHATDPKGGPCVIKVLLPQYRSQPDTTSMFRTEAELGLKLEHANLIRVYDHGGQSDVPYIVMEHVDGIPLSALAKPMSPTLALHVGREILSALQYIHELRDEDNSSLNIVHRDLSPKNVLVSAEGRVKLGDFGIAKSTVQTNRTRTGLIKGTLQYLSPEQVSCSDLDHRVDLYCVGLILFELLSGEPFIDGERDVQILARAEQPQWRSPAQHVASLGDRYDAILSRALRRFPEERYQSARSFSEALAKLQDDASVKQTAASALARSVTTSSEYRRLQQRRSGWPSSAANNRRSAMPWLVAGTASVLALIVAAVLWPSRRPQQPTLTAPTIAAPPAVQRQRVSPTPSAESTRRPPESLEPLPAATQAASASAGQTTEQSKQAASSDGPSTRSRTDKPGRTRRRATARAPRLSATKTHRVSTRSNTSAANAAALKELSAQQAQIKSLMHRRGLLASDLSPSTRTRLAAATAKVTKSSDKRALVRSLDQLNTELGSLAIDRAFVQTKLKRLDSRLKLLPSGSASERLRDQATSVLQNIMDRRYEAANRQLNAIFAQLTDGS